MSKLIETKMDMIERNVGGGLGEPSLSRQENDVRLSSRPRNGPLMIIVCTSCERAQHLIELVTEMIEMVRMRPAPTSLMIQGTSLVSPLYLFICD